VKLQETETDSLLADDRTDSYGRYQFAGVGPGDWTLKVTSSDSMDFATVTFQFVFSSADTALAVPPFDVSLAGLRLTSPTDSATVSVPSFVQPMTFTWRLPDSPYGSVQVRVSDAASQPVWYSDKLEQDHA
jgi:hypothetical protein